MSQFSEKRSVHSKIGSHQSNIAGVNGRKKTVPRMKNGPQSPNIVASKQPLRHQLEEKCTGASRRNGPVKVPSLEQRKA